ncbi:uncharacterized protein LOC128919833 [Zeugodacus cucurbitae]|uniref:uncharacterized protein LOC128919833 n=1 Tax=Zeugodacus cucurbitae TaxID=28588 RepID=UPI0023D91792|nr:uncharacterized protein LOC128919833 [Zeugodacus cucurbitae]
MQFFQNITTLLSLIELSTIDQQFYQVFSEICVATATEQRVHTFVYSSYEQNTYDNSLTKQTKPYVSNILQTLHMPNPIAVLNIGILAKPDRLVRQFNRNLLSIVQLSEDTHRNEQILDTLWQSLDRNMQSGIILLFNDATSDVYVRSILKLSANKGAVNSIALQPRMTVSERTYWTLEIFPRQETIRRRFPEHYRNIFPKHMKNLGGYPLRIVEDGWYPQIYYYAPKHGPATFSGYMGRTLMEYAHHRNATIQWLFSAEKVLFQQPLLLSSLSNDTVDTGILLPIEKERDGLSHSNVVHFSNWCLMMPLERPVPRYCFYYHIMDRNVFVLLCILFVLSSLIWPFFLRWEHQQPLSAVEYFTDFSMLRGLLGMPFWNKLHDFIKEKFVCISISFMGVIICTGYIAYLQSFSVDAPVEALIKTIGDILERNIIIIVDKMCVPALEQLSHVAKYVQNFTVLDNFTEVLLMRDTLDTRYAFPVTEMWSVYDEQQKYFSKPLFRLSDVCFERNMLLAFPLQHNSLFRQSLNDFLARLKAAGLINYWLQKSFLELVEMKVILLEDRNKQTVFKPLQWQDLHMFLQNLTALLGLIEIATIQQQFVQIITDISEVTAAEQQAHTLNIQF